MKDLFSGSLGRLNNHGGARMYTTPHTIGVQPEYEVETDIPSVAEFVTCTLDGRIWVYRRSRRYYIAVFRWDEDIEKLEFVSSSVLSNLNILGRGIDWILTDTTIIQVSDNEPYIHTANLFADSNTTFLYSILRSSVFSEKPTCFRINTGSGVDPVTKDTWGKSEDNGNIDGYGYFNRSALIQSVDKQYSLLPAVGDWNIIKNFLIRRVTNSLENDTSSDNPSDNVHNSMLSIRPLIPLEFNYYSSSYYSASVGYVLDSFPSYGTGYEHDIGLTYFYGLETLKAQEQQSRIVGQIWGRGLMHIGRCYILPAVFNENGTPEEFYLYISPDFLCSPYNIKKDISPQSNDEWLKIGLFCASEKLQYGFLTEHADSLNNGLCLTSETPKILKLYSKKVSEEEKIAEWEELSENGKLFVDPFNKKYLVLQEDSAILFKGDTTSEDSNVEDNPVDDSSAEGNSANDNSVYECQGLQKWLAPAMQVDAISDDVIISSCDNNALTTHIQQEFFRELLTANRLPISVSLFLGKQISLGESTSRNKKNIKVNAIKSDINASPIAWEDIYKNAVEISILNSFNHDFLYELGCPVFITEETTKARTQGYYGTGYYEGRFFQSDLVDADYHIVNRGYGWGTDSDGNTTYPCWSTETNYKGFYINPNNGEIINFSCKTSGHILSVGIIKSNIIGYDRYDYYGYESPATVYIEGGLFINDDGILGVEAYTVTMRNREGTAQSHFKPLITLPFNIGNWRSDLSRSYSSTDYISNSKLLLHNINIPNNIPENTTCLASAIFSEKKSNTKFLVNLPSVFKSTNGNISGILANIDRPSYSFYNYWNIDSLSEDETTYTQGLHIIIINGEDFTVFRSDLHPEIFNFNAEVERSKLF